jgi:predicted DsbA family dithiol-disulfide isomerase
MCCVEIAAAIGFDMDAVRAFLELDAGEREVVAEELQAQLDGVHSVPMIRVAGQAISGAQPAAVLAQALQAATVDDA